MSRAFALQRWALPAGCFGAGLGAGLYLRQRSSPTAEAHASVSSVAGAAPSDGPVDLFGAVGNTPLLELKTLSKLTGCKIYAKAEFMNPGGSVKDRAAKYLILDAESKGQLAKRGDTLIEATGGNTGVSLALLAAARGYKTIFTMHNQIAPEKIELMRVLGAQVELQTPASWLDREKHFYHVAKKIAAAAPKNSGVAYPDQFENTANMRAHYEGTGPEIWRQVRGNIDGFVAAAGTAGTLAGTSKFLKEKKSDMAVWLVDPEGCAGMSLFINNGGTTSTPKNGFNMVPARSGSSIAEGIALPRVTPNFREGVVDRGITVTNQETVDMAYFLLRNDGIFVGPSAALNVVGAVKMARELGPGHTIVTILCDGGDRYRSKLYNPKWLKEMKLEPRDLDNRDSLAFVGELSFPKE
jgi:cysteine synthase A